MPDGEMVWLFQDRGLGRVLFHQSDKVDLFLDTS